MSKPSTLGKYQILETIGRGGMGVIYKAHDPDMDRSVAIKTVRTDFLDEAEKQDLLKRFRGEAKAYGRLLHPNIVACYSCDEIDDLVYIVMEYVDGESLQQQLNRGKKFTIENTIAIIGQLLDALEYSHTHHVIHRDIKPGNIMILPDGKMKVTDFGVAKVDSTHLTQTGHVVGSPDYMSPEQFQGKSADNRSDLYSVGVIFYQLLTGKKPFEGPDLGAVLHNVLNQTPEKPSTIGEDIPPLLDAIVMTAISKSAKDRYQTADEFKNALSALSRETANEGQAAEPTINISQTEISRSYLLNSLDTAILKLNKSTRFLTSGVLIAIVIVLLMVFLFNSSNESDVANIEAGDTQKEKPELAEIAHEKKLEKVLAPASLNASDIGVLAAGYKCAQVFPKLEKDKVVLTGFVSSEDDLIDIYQRINSLPGVGALETHIEVLDWPYCELVSTLYPYLDLKTRSGKHSVLPQQFLNYVEEEYLNLDLVTPENYPSNIYVDYFLMDGTVVHMLPNAEEPNNRFSPGQDLSLGKPGKPGRKWKIEAPFGEEMVSIIASKNVLYVESRPEIEPAKDYLTLLNTSLDGVNEHNISANIVNIVTRPRNSKTTNVD
ncbi:MAG: protein kinase [Gammaproteobacteria bacterium]